jgi:hypothetical protein
VNLRAVTRREGGNRYCGPAVVSVLAGVDTDEAARRFREVSGRPAIRGTSTTEMRRVLGAFGLALVTQPKRPAGWVGPGLTLAGWLRFAREDRTPGRVFLVVAGRHWQLISGRRYVCGITREVVSIRDERVKRRARVTEVYEVQRAAGGAS